MRANVETQKEPIRYWFVEITLTSGEILKFYVKAKNEFEAHKSADGYSQWTCNEQLLNKLRIFKLMV